MIKFQVTQELTTLLKMLRTQNHISATDLATHIGKSVSYISKLENHQIKTIQEKELTSILSFITVGEDFFADKYPSIIQLLSTFIEPEQIIRQLWLIHYEAFLRPVTIPEAVIEDFTKRLNRLHTTAEEFVDRINACEDFKYLKKLPPNQIVEVSYHNKKSIFIHFVIDKNAFVTFLNHQPTFLRQSDLFRIVLQFYREELLPGVAINDENEDMILNHTVTYLEHYNLCPMIYQCFMPSPQELHTSLLSMKQSYASNSSKQISEKLQLLQETVSAGELGTITAMETLQENLNWDPAFTLKILNIPFHELESMSFHFKKELLDEINAIFQKYKNIPEIEKSLEKY